MRASASCPAYKSHRGRALARRHNFTFADALYVALAVDVGASLLNRHYAVGRQGLEPCTLGLKVPCSTR